MNFPMVLTYLKMRLDIAHGEETGASAVEYGLLVALIAAVIAAAVFTLGGTLNGIFGDTNNCISSPGQNC